MKSPHNIPPISSSLAAICTHTICGSSKRLVCSPACSVPPSGQNQSPQSQLERHCRRVIGLPQTARAFLQALLYNVS